MGRHPQAALLLLRLSLSGLAGEAEGASSPGGGEDGEGAETA